MSWIDVPQLCDVIASTRPLRRLGSLLPRISYRNGANGYFPPHLFIGRASDGRWPIREA